jgi:hypothetical protein
MKNLKYYIPIIGFPLLLRDTNKDEDIDPALGLSVVWVFVVSVTIAVFMTGYLLTI